MDMRTVGAEHGGGEAAARAQKLPPDGFTKPAQVLRQQRDCGALLVQHRVAVGLLKAQHHGAPETSTDDTE